jgi:selenocysteine lyase/cysteine desulfurase
MVWAGAKDYSEFLALPALIRGWWRAEDAPGPLQDPAGAHQDAPGMAATAAAPDMARRSGSLAESVNYQRRTLSEAVAMLSDAWGTAPLVPASEGFNMSLVRLPPLDPRSVLHFASGDCKNRSSSSSSGTTTAAAAAAVSADSSTSDLPASATLTGKAVQDALHFGHAIECPVKTVGGQLYVRISAAVYNERSDYEALARAVDAMRRR